MAVSVTSPAGSISQTARRLQRLTSSGAMSARRSRRPQPAPNPIAVVDHHTVPTPQQAFHHVRAMRPPIIPVPCRYPSIPESVRSDRGVPGRPRAWRPATHLSPAPGNSSSPWRGAAEGAAVCRRVLPARQAGDPPGAAHPSPAATLDRNCRDYGDPARNRHRRQLHRCRPLRRCDRRVRSAKRHYKHDLTRGIRAAVECRLASPPRDRARLCRLPWRTPWWRARKPADLSADPLPGGRARPGGPPGCAEWQPGCLHQRRAPGERRADALDLTRRGRRSGARRCGPSPFPATLPRNPARAGGARPPADRPAGTAATAHLTCTRRGGLSPRR